MGKAQDHRNSWQLAVGGWQLVAVGGWQLVAVGGWQLVAVGGWQLVAVGGWQLVAVGGWQSLGAVLEGCPWQKRGKIGVLKDSPACLRHPQKQQTVREHSNGEMAGRIQEDGHAASVRSAEGSWGAFSHSAGSAPIITMIIQVTTLKTTHLRNHAQSIQNSKIQTSDVCHGSQGPKFCPL